jgi:hypothetical protein
MENEMRDEKEILNDQVVRHDDICDNSELNAESPRRGKRRKLLVMLCGLTALLILAGAAAYFLFTRKEVRIKASHKSSEKITSGRYLQKAAYDSLSGLLDGTSPANTPMISGVPGNEVKVAMPGVTPSPGLATDGPKIPTPVQPGIAMTIAPPPEALLANQAENNQRTTEVKTELGTGGSASNNTSVSSAFGKPKTDASILFASFPGSLKTSADSRKETKTSAISLERRESRDSNPKLTRARTTPDFGAMLPVRLMGVLYTLRAGSLARLELTRDINNERWTLKRGTVFVGALLGSDLDRGYVQIRGFIDPETNGFMKLEGELLGSDGGAGLRGKHRRISPVWVKILDRAAQAGTQILTSVLGRNSSVIVATDPYGTYRSASGADQSQQNNRTFVEVPAGAVGFVLVTTLPEPTRPDSHLASSELLNSKGTDLSDTDLANLLAEADAGRIREQLPRMNPELRRVAEMVLKEIEVSDKARSR